MTAPRRQRDLTLPFADGPAAASSPRPAAGPPSVPSSGPAPSSDEAPIGVGELDRRLRLLLERRTDGVWVHGEVSQVKEVGSGHTYFVLRDEGEDASIDGVLYRTAPVRTRRAIVEGARVVVQGRATVYAPRGRLQLVVDSARPAGRGALLEALDRLRRKLAAEGLFAPERKRPLPQEPRVIGVVTSADGAALHDVVKVAFRRAGVRIVLARAAVQGPRAAETLVRAIALLGRHPEVEAIVVTRGGGSSDDLAAFQEEVVVRAIAASPVPVVSAVGHEVDVTLADLVADARAATPSQAAELLVPDDRARGERLRHLRARLARAARHELGRRRQVVDDLGGRIRVAVAQAGTRRRRAIDRLERRLAERHPRTVLASERAQTAALSARLSAAMRGELRAIRLDLDDAGRRLDDAARDGLAARREALSLAAARLDALSPLAVLGRGYAVALDRRGRAVVDAADVVAGEPLRVRVARGTIDATVVATHAPIGAADGPREEQ